MADKKIQDFTVLEDAQDNDLILVSSNDETYTMKVKTIKDAVQGDADRAEAAAQEAKGMIEGAISAANKVTEQAAAATLSASGAASLATEKAQEAQNAATAATNAKTAAETATNSANGAAENANAKANAAQESATAANTAASAATTAATQATTAATAANTAAGTAQAQGNFAKEQGDIARSLLDVIEKMEAGELAAEVAKLGKAENITYKNRTVADALEALERLSVSCAGVEWDYANPSTELQRLTRATDPNGYVTIDVLKEPVPAVGTGAGSSPFDNIMPWAGMEEYNIVNGEIAATRGDNNFSRSNDTMVFIPEFYYFIEDDAAAQKRRFYIANAQLSSSFQKHPGSGRYVARYNTGDGYVSKTGLPPLTNITRAAARTGSTSKGAKWYQYDYATWCAIWLLYLVEYADWDSQSAIGPGNVSSSEKKDTGGTDAMVYHTGRAFDDSDENGDVWHTAQVQYRHIEDPWGNVFDWVDGVVFDDRLMYVCFNPDQYADDTSEGYTSTGMSMVSGNNYISKLGFSSDHMFAFIPSEQNGDDVSYIPDYANSYTGLRVLRVGGSCSSATYAGMFYFSANATPTLMLAYGGARLLFIP